MGGHSSYGRTVRRSCAIRCIRAAFELIQSAARLAAERLIELEADGRTDAPDREDPQTPAGTVELRSLRLRRICCFHGILDPRPQDAFGEMPVPGCAAVATKSKSAGATTRLPNLIRPTFDSLGMILLRTGKYSSRGEKLV